MYTTLMYTVCYTGLPIIDVYFTTVHYAAKVYSILMYTTLLSTLCCTGTPKFNVHPTIPYHTTAHPTTPHLTTTVCRKGLCNTDVHHTAFRTAVNFTELQYTPQYCPMQNCRT